MRLQIRKVAGSLQACDVCAGPEILKSSVACRRCRVSQPVEARIVIVQCQSKDVKVILSMGGAVGNYGFNSAADAIAYANFTSDYHFICCACLMVIWEYRAPWQTAKLQAPLKSLTVRILLKGCPASTLHETLSPEPLC